jgi:GNAT superfamily N-acetyltransferase
VTTGVIQLVETGPAGIDRVLPFVREFYEHFGYAYDETRKRALLNAFLAEPTAGRLWQVHDAAEPVGYLLMAFSFSLEMDGRIAFVDELFITPAGRSKGAGARALALAEAACHELGVRTLRLEAEADNSRAAALYLRQGYVDLGRCLLSKPLGPITARDQD